MSLEQAVSTAVVTQQQRIAAIIRHFLIRLMFIELIICCFSFGVLLQLIVQQEVLTDEAGQRAMTVRKPPPIIYDKEQQCGHQQHEGSGKGYGEDKRQVSHIYRI